MRTRLTAISMAIMLTGLVAAPIVAYTTAADYPYRVPVNVKNTTGSTYTGLACAQFNVAGLISEGYMATTAQDYRIEHGTTFPAPSFLGATDTSDACAWLPVTELTNGSTDDFSIYMGVATAPLDQVGIWGSSSDIATVSYDAKLNPAKTLHVRVSTATVGASTDLVTLGDSYQLGLNSSGQPFATIGATAATAVISQDTYSTYQTMSRAGDALGQTFTVGGDDIDVTKIEIFSKYNSGSGTDFYLGFYTVDGSGSPYKPGLQGSVAQLDLDTSTSYEWKTAEFSSPISLNQNTMYAIGTTSSGSGDTQHRWAQNETANPLGSDGSRWWNSEGGAAGMAGWTGVMDAEATGHARTFRIYTGGGGSPITVTGSTVTADEEHYYELDFSSNTLVLKVDGVSVGSATNSTDMKTVTDQLVIASSSVDAIRSIGRVEVASTSADADNVLDLTFSSDTVTKTQTGSSGNGHKWVYSIADVSGNNLTASMSLVSNLTTVASTLAPMVVTTNTAPRGLETSPDPWATAFGSAVEDPIKDSFTKAEVYRWPMSVISPSFNNGGLPLQLGAAIIAATLAVILGGAALLLTRIPAFGLLGAIIAASVVIALTPLPNVLMVMMVMLALASSFLVPRFWESAS
jgi:hypothetical protein